MRDEIKKKVLEKLIKKYDVYWRKLSKEALVDETISFTLQETIQRVFDEIEKKRDYWINKFYATDEGRQADLRAFVISVKDSIKRLLEEVE